MPWRAMLGVGLGLILAGLAFLAFADDGEGASLGLLVFGAAVSVILAVRGSRATALGLALTLIVALGGFCAVVWFLVANGVT